MAGRTARRSPDVADRVPADAIAAGYAIDARKIELELGWKPSETFESGDHEKRFSGTWKPRTGGPCAKRKLPRVGGTTVRPRRPRKLGMKILSRSVVMAEKSVGSCSVRCRYSAKVVALGTAPSSNPGPAGAVTTPPCSTPLADDAAEGETLLRDRQRRRIHRRSIKPLPAGSGPATINALAPAAPASQASALGAWLAHVSPPTMPLTEAAALPWTEEQQPKPLSVYGQSKWRGAPTPWLPPAAPGFSNQSAHAAKERGTSPRPCSNSACPRDTLSVIDDQHGAPTSAELVADCTAHALRSALATPALAGLYHRAAAGETSWHGYAQHVLARCLPRLAPQSTCRPG